MSASWYVLAVATVLTVVLAAFQIGNVASIHENFASYNSDVVAPGDPPAAPLSRLEFWGQFLPTFLLVLVLMDTMPRLVYPGSNGWKYVHIIVSALWLVASAVLVIWMLIVIVPGCNTTANNICTDERFCCKNQEIAPAVDPAPGCPIFLQGCSPDQTTVTLTWNPGFTWLIVLLWIDVLFAILHIVLSWWVGSHVSQWVVDHDSKAIYSPVTETRMESGNLTTNAPLQTGTNITSYKNFTPVAAVGITSKLANKQS